MRRSLRSVHRIVSTTLGVVDKAQQLLLVDLD